MSRRTLDVTPELMLRAYSTGLFPMAETRESKRLYWLDPDKRGILPLDGFHLPRRLLRTALSHPYAVAVDQDFPAVIGQCAATSLVREDSWINPQIERLFTQLHLMGHAHSVECRQDGVLVGGLYGVKLGGAFFGESMFSRARDASKIALVHLVAMLRLGGFTLLDTQFVTTHLTQFGAVEIPREAYRARLAAAIAIPARWRADWDPAVLAAEFRAIAAPAGPA